MQLDHGLAFLLLAAIGSLTSLYLFGIYRKPPDDRRARRAAAYIDRWNFTPLRSRTFVYGPLILASCLGLFIELLLIRWVSSEIRIFAYFKNFVLIACFLGFGLGCHFCRRRLNLLPLVVPLVFLTLLVKLPWTRLMLEAIPSYLGVFSEVHVWGVPSLPLGNSAFPSFIAAVLITIPLFALISLVFIPIGQLVGWYLENSTNGILAYSVNVLASLAGILLYTILCFLNQPPTVWFGVAGVLLVAQVWHVPRARWTAALALALCTGVLSLVDHPATTVHWSPYQKLSLTPITQGSEVTAYYLETNDVWYQQIVNLSPEFLESHKHLLGQAPVEFDPYNLPYRFYPDPPAVLVLGAGMGNDVAAALRNGAQRVVAVEIDPLILALGKELHFEKPYDSSRVTTVVDDARSYFQNSHDRFDLVMFSLLDSHTNSSHFSNIRIDNYVYTLEALTRAKRLLKPDGIFIIKFQVDTPWIAGRLRETMSSVFGSPPEQLRAEGTYGTRGTLFVAGSRERMDRALAEKTFAAYLLDHKNVRTEKAAPATDDWPYFYQRAPGLPASVIVISLVLVLVSWLAMKGTGLSGSSINWHFFFLGAGFLLLEVQIVSKMALLFGTTWLVNSVVIAGMLLFIVGANVLVAMVPSLSITVSYIGLAASISLSYLVPLHWFFFESIWLRGLVSTVVLCIPVFFAGIIFIKSFAGAAFSGSSLGSNLMGALVGGMLESVSLWIGIKSLLVVAGLLYAFSYWCMRRDVAGESVLAPEKNLTGAV